MDEAKIEETRLWLDTPLDDGRTTREHLNDCQPIILRIAVQRLR